MISTIALIVALQSTGGTPSNSNRATSPTSAATPVAIGTDAQSPEVLARTQFIAFATGKVDQSQYSVSIPRDAVIQVQSGLSTLGAVRSVALIGSTSMLGSNVYIYKFTCAHGAVVEQISVKDGKINGIYFRPAP